MDGINGHIRRQVMWQQLGVEGENIQFGKLNFAEFSFANDATGITHEFRRFRMNSGCHSKLQSNLILY